MKLRILFTTLTLATVSAGVLSIPVQGQQTPSPSVADAARAAQAQKPNSGTPPKVITNDDLAPRAIAATPEATSQAAPANSTAAPQTPANEPSKPTLPQSTLTTPSSDCNNPERNDAIQAELQAAQAELDQLRRDLAYDPKVISDNDVDMRNFKPGSAGVGFSSPPMSQTQPQSPDRVKEVILEQKLASLKKAVVIACDSPENGDIQRRIDEVQKQLNLAQRELDLDSSTYYSKPNYTQDTAGKAKIAAEQEQVQSLQSEINSLKQELAASKSN
jgi:hypothetical protein